LQYKNELNLDDPLLGLPSEEAERLLRGFGDQGGHDIPTDSVEHREDRAISEGDLEDEAEIPVPSFPMEVLPDDLLRYVDSASISLGVAPEVFATMALTVLSSSVGNSLRVCPKKDFRVAPFLWAAIVMPSGSGKSPAMSQCMRPIKEAQQIAYAAYKDLTGIYESELDAYRRDKNKSLPCPEKPTLEHFYVDNITVESLADVFEGQPRGVLCPQDELSGLVLGLNQYKGTGNDKQHYLSLFNCQPLKIDRRSGSRVVSNTGLAILGGIQPLVLPKIMGQESFADGFIQRFIFCCPDVTPPKFSRESIPDARQKFWEQLIAWCLEIPLEKHESGQVKPAILTPSPAALDRWITFYDQFAELQTILLPRMAGFIPKLHLYSLKFAGILHVIKGFVENRHIPATIDLETIEGAVKLVEYYYGQVRRIMGLYCEKKKVNGQRQRILKTLHNLRGEVKNGMLKLSKIVDGYNEGLPANFQITSQKIASLLRNDLGLATRKGTGNLAFLFWEGEKLEKYFKTSSNCGNCGNSGGSGTGEKVTSVTLVTTISEENSESGREGTAAIPGVDEPTTLAVDAQGQPAFSEILEGVV